MPSHTKRRNRAARLEKEWSWCRVTTEWGYREDHAALSDGRRPSSRPPLSRSSACQACRLVLGLCFFDVFFFFDRFFFDADLMIMVVEPVRVSLAPACLIAALKSARISA